MSKKKADEVKAALRKKSKKEKSLAKFPMLSTGLTLLNLNCTDHPRKGIPMGSYTLIVGDSAAGKTWLTLQLMAEAANDPRFDDYALIHDDAEGGAKMNKAKYFGKKAASRIRLPGEYASTTIEEFYDNAEAALDEGPCIYAIDSQDVLTSAAEQKKIKQQKAERLKGKEESGSMTDAKAKVHSQRLRGLVTKYQRNKSILLILCSIQSQDPRRWTCPPVLLRP
jgi:GTPase SAR1 family protein